MKIHNYFIVNGGLSFFDLFAGIGGFHLGMSQAGHHCVGACEIDKYARLVYGKQFPNIRVWEDATKLNAAELPDFDVLTGGFPCQAFSIAGQRRGFEDTRGSLFFEIARIAKEKRPRYLLLENVKGLLNHDSGNTFRVIISTLDEMGYDAEWQVLNSKYFVPQNRERVFIVGCLRGERTRKIFPLGESNQRNNGTRQKIQGKGQRIWDTPSGSIQTSPQKGASTLIANTLDATYYKGYGSRTMIYMAHSKGNIKQRIQDRNESWTLTNNSGDFGVIVKDKIWKGQSGIVYDPKGISPTICASDGKSRGYNSSGYINDKTRIRRLTPKECERLQGFPDGWTKLGKNDVEISDTQRYKCLGNAVTVAVVKYVAENLI